MVATLNKYFQAVLELTFHATKFEEHRLAVRRGIVLLILRTNVSIYFPANYDSVLQTNVRNSENLKCGFSSEAISLR